MFTPVVRESAIGRVAALVCRELVKEGHQVVVVRSEIPLYQTDHVHDFGVPVTAWSDERAVEIAVHESEVVVYQFGDNYQLHAGCIHWIERVRGLVCLHDFFLGNLFNGWASDTSNDPVALVSSWYGADAAITYSTALGKPDFSEQTVTSSPLTKWICGQALATLTHSSWGIEEVRQSCPGPVTVAGLPYDARTAEVNTAESSGQFNLLTFGRINTNKRVPSVIRAIGKNAWLRESITYTIVGSIDPKSIHQLASLARSLNVRIVITGAIDDRALDRRIMQADAIVALRSPTLEAASASAIETMLSGRPLIVTRLGFYDEIPDDCVLKIDPTDEVDGVAEALVTILRDPSSAAEMADRAAMHARESYCVDRYVVALLELAQAAVPLAPMLSAIDDIARTLGRWGESTLPGEEHFFDPLTELWSSE